MQRTIEPAGSFLVVHLRGGLTDRHEASGSDGREQMVGGVVGVVGGGVGDELGHDRMLEVADDAHPVHRVIENTWIFGCWLMTIRRSPPVLS